MIFERRGKWFMLTNIDSAAMGEHQFELHVFSADAFDSDTWVANKNNPVIFDAKMQETAGFYQRMVKYTGFSKRILFQLMARIMVLLKSSK